MNLIPEPKRTRETIIMNSTHYIGKNIYKYKLSSPITFKKATLSIQQISMYNSTYNITALRGNNTFSIRWNSVIYNFTLPDGYYSVDKLNESLQYEMFKQNLYMLVTVGSTIKQVYFLNISSNSVRYRIQIDISPVPTSANATTLGYSKPPGATWSFPTSDATPQFIFNSNTQSLLGFSAGIYPSSVQSSSYQTVGETYPTMTPVFTYLFSTNLVDNKLKKLNIL